MEDNLMVKPAKLPQVLLENYSYKKTYSIRKIMLLAIMAGIYIGLGAMASGIVSHSIENFGVSKLLAGLVFPLGLMAVVITGSELFTGNVMIFTPLVDKRVKFSDYLRNLTLVWFFNLTGAFLLCFMAYKAGIFNLNDNTYGAYLIKLAHSKVSFSFSKGIFSGILCNIMVCLAVYLALAAKDIAGKVLIIWFIIGGFIIAGFEHCVANMYYLIGGLFSKMDTSIVQKSIDAYHMTYEKIAALNVKNIFLSNLLPVTIGNIIGGVIFIGLLYYYAYGYDKIKES